MKQDSVPSPGGALSAIPERGLSDSEPAVAAIDGVAANCAIPLLNFPRALDLFGFILSKQTRERVFEPEYDDFAAMWIRARHADEYQTIPARLCLNFAFAVRASLLAARCFRVPVWVAGFAGALRFIPPLWKHLEQWLFSR